MESIWRNPWIRALALVAGVCALLGLGYVLQFVLAPLFFAFIVAYAFDPLVDFFEARRVPRMTAVLGLVVLLLLVMTALPLMFVPMLIGEAQDLVKASQRAMDAGWLESWVAALPLDDAVRALGWAPEGAADFDARAVLAERLGETIRTGLLDWMRAHGAQLAGAGQKAGASAVLLFSSVGTGVMGLVGFLGNVVVFAFVAIYLLADYDRIVAGIDDLVPPRHRGLVRRVMGKIDKQLQAFFRGQAFVCLCLGAMYAIGYSIAGVPFALAIAVLGGVAGFIPYLGPVLAALPALLMALLEGGELYTLAGIAITLGAAQAVEGNFLTPKIVGSQVGLHPVWVILAILVLGTWLGLLGMLMAVPLAASLKVLVEEGVAYYKTTSFFQGKPGAGGGEEA